MGHDPKMTLIGFLNKICCHFYRFKSGIKEKL